MLYSTLGRRGRLILTIALTGTVLIATVAIAAASPVFDRLRDPGAKYERELNENSKDYFGFGKPVAQSAATISNTEPGDKAVDVAKGLKVRIASDRVGENADMIALWPDNARPTHVIFCNEINGTTAGAAASVQRLDLATGQVSAMIYGMISCDPAKRTPWGTIVVGEEAGSTGRGWEILDPLNVNNVTVDRNAGTSSDPTHVVALSALGTLSYEGIVILPNGIVYYGDELRPGGGKPGGGIYKFVPVTLRDPNAGPITNLGQSPLSAGSVYVLRVGVRSGGTDYGQGSNTGAGKWIGPLPVTSDLASAALAAGGYTGYYRPEDMDLDPVAWANGTIRFCWTNTGNDVGDNWGEVLCAVDAPTADPSFATSTRPVVTTLVVGNPSLRMPDNIDFQPSTGILYVLMDATTSAENPAFTNDDVWACLPDGADSDTLSDGCVRVMTLKDGAAEFTGIEFLADGKSFFIDVQHRTQTGRAVPHTTDMLRISGLKAPGHDD